MKGPDLNTGVCGTLSLAISTVGLSALSVFIGVIDINWGDILGGDTNRIDIMLISRLPRLWANLCAGAGMSVAGLIMQALCQNKFVSPTTGATIQSSQFGILTALIFLPGATLTGKAIFAFIFAILGTWTFIFFIRRVKFGNVVMVPLAGIMFGNIIGGVTDYLSFKYGLMQALSSWLVGDFSLIIRGRYELVFMAVPLIAAAFIFANHFNVVGMGEDFSKNLGVNYNLVLFSGLSISALITASVVVTVGSIPYLGLIVPNLVSMFKGDKIRGSLLDAALFGAGFVLLCDIIGRLVIFPYELPVNLIVGILGSLIFLGLLLRRLNPATRKSMSA